MRFYHTNGTWTDHANHPIPTAPLQLLSSDRHIPRVIAEEAYKEYAAQYGRNQSFERLCERGGFSACELAQLLFERIKRLEQGGT
jgi:hypothetical protein